jgi:nucleoside 2-deoxyribosyltransferase
MKKCLFCQSDSSIQEGDYGYEQNVSCAQCGKYKIRQPAIDQLSNTKLHLVSSYVRRQFDNGIIPEVTKDDLIRIYNLPEVPLTKKIDLLLSAYTKDLDRYNQDVPVTDKKYIAIISAKDEKEYQYIYSQVLKEKGYIQPKPSGTPYRITTEGWIYAESLNKQNSSNQGFVAMWFDDSMNQIYKNAIEPAFNSTGYTPLRIDQKEHNDKIDDQIIAEIQRSRFLIADFTGHRGGVYFEAGYALGRGIPVIWTCKKDDIEKLHFDIRQYNTIDWVSESDLKERLHQRIRATIG